MDEYSRREKLTYDNDERKCKVDDKNSFNKITHCEKHAHKEQCVNKFFTDNNKNGKPDFFEQKKFTKISNPTTKVNKMLGGSKNKKFNIKKWI